ncbi:MAG: Stf0 family sulfotransferase [Planctomycetota bacterium]
MTQAIPVFIVAQQRSGTNFLRKSLAATGDFFDADEVFHPEKPGFWQFANQIRFENPMLMVRTSQNLAKIFDEFIKQLAVSVSKSAVLIDVKYNSVHNLNGFWHEDFQQPNFIRWLQKTGYPVIHLVRHNVLENYVSFRIACENQAWVVEADRQKPRNINLRLDPEQTVRELIRRTEEIDRFRNLLEPTQCLEVSYETLVETQISGAILRTIQNHLKIEQPIQIDHSPTQKTGRKLENVVVNLHSEILPVLADRGFQYDYPLPVPAAVKSKSEAEAVAITAGFHLDNLTGLDFTGPSTPVFIISHQGSGATEFRSWLTRHDEVNDAGELLAPTSEFWQLVSESCCQNPELGNRSRESQLRLLNQYLTKATNRGTKFTLFNIYYNSIHLFNSAWHHLGDPHLLLEWIMRQNFPVIHVYQDDPVESALKNVIYQSPMSDIQTIVDVGAFKASIVANQTRVQQFKRWLSNSNSTDAIFGQDFNSDAMSLSFRSSIAKFLGLCFSDDPSLGISNQNQFEPSSQSNRGSVCLQVPNYFSELIPALLDDETCWKRFTTQKLSVPDAVNPVVGRRSDLLDHLKMLAGEFDGLPEICFAVATKIVLIRRRIEVERHFADLELVLRRFLKVICEQLSTRWLVAICDTIADHGTPLQAANSLQLVIWINTLKLAETERVFEQRPTANHRYQGKSISSMATFLESWPHSLWDGVSSYLVTEGDMPRNMFGRMRKSLSSTPLLLQIFETLIDRMDRTDNLFSRMARLNRGGFWQQNSDRAA